MKRIIVTGAAGGIGFSVIKYLNEYCNEYCNEYFIYALDIKEVQKLENVKGIVCDLTKEDNIRYAYDLIKNDLGDAKIDAIIHLSGTYSMDSLIEIEEDKLKKIFDINFFSVYLVNKIFFDLLDKNSKIIITSSEVAPLDPLPFNSIYSLTKNTLENYALALRQELNLLDIKVILVRPGAINTGLIDESIKHVERVEKDTKLYKDNAPLFKDIVKNNESKTIEPIEIAKLMKKILDEKNSKLLYTINLNYKLILLSSLPKRLQLFIIKKMITPNKSEEEK